MTQKDGWLLVTNDLLSWCQTAGETIICNNENRKIPGGLYVLCGTIKWPLQGLLGEAFISVNVKDDVSISSSSLGKVDHHFEKSTDKTGSIAVIKFVWNFFQLTQYVRGHDLKDAYFTV